MPTKHRFRVQVPIPQEISPATVISTLQTFEPLLSNHRHVANYRPISKPMSSRDIAAIKKDPFFRHDCADLSPQSIAHSSTAATNQNSRWWIYDVWEDVYWVPVLLPYFSRLKRYMAVGCKTASGIRFRQSVAGGVTTRGTFTVVSRRTGRAYGARCNDDDDDGDSWDSNTDKGSVTSRTTNEKSSEDRASERRSSYDDNDGDGDEKKKKKSMSWDGETDIESESESEPVAPAWDIVCDCEVEVPLIISVPQLLMRNADRKLCEHLCRSVIKTAVTQWNEYWFTT
ncbi:hypothetical protein GGR50DRAFT_58830 [Xylaria sp. CBS 124048]|nr:hypothetical protein GGR50DRAFT_58830 [Xylaria sp. CBS 124048]